MNIFVSIGILVICIWVIIDDFKNRQINILAPILLFLLIISETFFSTENHIITMFTNYLVNLLLILLIFIITYTYFKYLKKVENPWESHLGIGDLLFFLSLIGIGNTPTFIVFFLVCTVFSALVGVVGITFFNWETIPYAGISAIVLGFVSILNLMNISITKNIEKLILT